MGKTTMSSFRVFNHVRRGRGLESWDQYVSPSRRVVSALPEYAPATVAARPGVCGERGGRHQPRTYPPGLLPSELAAAEAAWAQLPDWDALVRGTR